MLLMVSCSIAFWVDVLTSVRSDEEPYISAGSEDLYAYCKSQGKFLPTRRTSGISTSELLSRIVEGYRGGDYDNKLEKIGHPELMSRGPSEAGSYRSTRSADMEVSRPASISQSPVAPTRMRELVEDQPME